MMQAEHNPKVINNKNPMKENLKTVELLVGRAVDFGKMNLELTKLKAIDKSADIISSLIPHLFSIIFFGIFLLFLNLGLSFFLGEFFNSTFLGFFAIAAFYAVTGLFFRFVLHKKLKLIICNLVIKKFLN